MYLNDKFYSRQRAASELKLTWQDIKELELDESTHTRNWGYAIGMGKNIIYARDWFYTLLDCIRTTKTDIANVTNAMTHLNYKKYDSLNDEDKMTVTKFYTGHQCKLLNSKDRLQNTLITLVRTVDELMNQYPVLLTLNNNSNSNNNEDKDEEQTAI